MKYLFYGAPGRNRRAIIADARKMSDRRTCTPTTVAAKMPAAIPSHKRCPMPSGQQDPPSPSIRSPLRFELVLGGCLLLFGLVVLPSLIYMVGAMLLGEYSGGGHLGSFYGDVFRDLGQGSPQAWILALGPLVLVELGRLIFFNFGARTERTTEVPRDPPPRKAKPEPRERREPTFRA